MSRRPEPPASDLTGLLNSWSDGDREALERLAPLLQSELRGLAHAYFARNGPGATLQPTALVNEAFLRLLGRQGGVSWQSRAHFFAFAAKTMRNILVNYAVAKQTGKRGGAAVHVSLDGSDAATEPLDMEVLAIHQALERLSGFDPRKSQMIELRFFAGLTAEETAEVLGMSEANVRREWVLARAWLLSELSGSRLRARNADG